MLWGHRRKSEEDELEKVIVKCEFGIYKGEGDEMGVSDSAQPLGSTMAGERWAGNAKGSLENAEGPSSQVKSRHEA